MNEAEVPKNAAQPGFFEQARQLIRGQREKDYGDKLTNFTHIARSWNALLSKRIPGINLTAEDVAAMMIVMKLCRLQHSPDHADSILDVAGYAGCYDDIRKRRMETETGKIPIPRVNALAEYIEAKEKASNVDRSPFTTTFPSHISKD